MRVGEGSEEFVGLLAIMEYDSPVAFGTLGEKAADAYAMVGGKYVDVGEEFGIDFVLDPRHIVALATKSLGDTGEAYLKGIVEEYDGVTFVQAKWEGADVSPIENPPLLFEQFGETGVELLTGCHRTVRTMPYQVEVTDGEACYGGEAPGKGAFARSRRAYDDYFFHGGEKWKLAEGDERGEMKTGGS